MQEACWWCTARGYRHAIPVRRNYVIETAAVSGQGRSKMSQARSGLEGDGGADTDTVGSAKVDQGMRRRDR